MAEATVSADEFFGWVDEFLTPSMTALGYNRLGGTENNQPMSRQGLTHPPTSARRGAPQSPPVLLYDFGFEAASAEVKDLVCPEDPESADELWLSFEPATGELDLRDWVRIARGRVDWDPWLDTRPSTRAEVRRRLAVLGRAVADFGTADI